MSVTAQDLKTLIIDSLAQADPTARAELQQNVGVIWTLYNRCAYRELQYWYTRRDAIRLLQACVSRRIDYSRRNQQSTRTALQTARADMTMQSVSQDDSSSVSDRISDSESSSVSDGAGSGNSLAQRNQTQSADSNSQFDDTGQGLNYSSRYMHQETTTDDHSDVKTYTKDDTAMLHERKDSGYREGYHKYDMPAIAVYVFSLPDGKKIGFSIHINAFTLQWTGMLITLGPFDWFFDFTPPVSVWQDSTVESSGHTHHQIDKDNTIGDLGGNQSRRTRTDITLPTGVPTREMTMDIEDHAGDQAHSQHSEFTANVGQLETANSQADMTAQSEAVSSNTLTGNASGQSTSSGTGRNLSDAHSSRNASGTGETRSSNQAVSQTDSIMERLHQQFLHLDELWKRADAMITWLESQRLSVPAYVVGRMTLQYPEGVGADVANSFLVRQPGF